MHFVRGDKENSNDSFSSVSIFVTVNVFKRIESLARFIIQMEFLKKFSLFRLQKKASPTVQGSVKSPLAIDSDISNIESKWKRINITSISISNNIFFLFFYSRQHFIDIWIWYNAWYKLPKSESKRNIWWFA